VENLDRYGLLLTGVSSFRGEVFVCVFFQCVSFEWSWLRMKVSGLLVCLVLSLDIFFHVLLRITLCFPGLFCPQTGEYVSFIFFYEDEFFRGAPGRAWGGAARQLQEVLASTKVSECLSYAT
jgi:hypothetical protein